MKCLHAPVTSADRTTLHLCSAVQLGGIGFTRADRSRSRTREKNPWRSAKFLETAC